MPVLASHIISRLDQRQVLYRVATHLLLFADLDAFLERIATNDEYQYQYSMSILYSLLPLYFCDCCFETSSLSLVV